MQKPGQSKAYFPLQNKEISKKKKSHVRNMGRKSTKLKAKVTPMMRKNCWPKVPWWPILIDDDKRTG